MKSAGIVATQAKSAQVRNDPPTRKYPNPPRQNAPNRGNRSVVIFIVSDLSETTKPVSMREYATYLKPIAQQGFLKQGGCYDVFEQSSADTRTLW